MLNWLFAEAVGEALVGEILIGDGIEEEVIDKVRGEIINYNYNSDNLVIIKHKLERLQNENYKLNKEINHTYLNVLEIHKKIKALNEQITVNNKEVDNKITKLDDRIKVVEEKLASYVLVE